MQFFYISLIFYFIEPTLTLQFYKQIFIISKQYQSQPMFDIIIGLFIAYSIYKIIRRKLVKPNYEGQTVWITGASSGIGEFLAYEFNKHGADLIISARNQKELQRVKKACSNPDKVKVIKLDMTKYDDVEKVTQNVISSLQKSGKRLDVVVENAGVSMRCEFVDYPFENHLAMFDVNVNGPYKHIQSFLPHMIKNKAGQIVGISSAAGKLAPAYRSSYGGSKHALIGIFDSLRTEMAPHNIKVTTILPGYVKTNISKNALAAEAGKSFGKTDTNIEKGMEVDDFAREAVRAIFRGENETQISKSLIVPLGIQLRNICPDLAFFGLVFNSKNQSKAVKEAKKE